ncbi:MAG: SCO family protein [Gammaproteobacteria bacterium]
MATIPALVVGLLVFRFSEAPAFSPEALRHHNFYLRPEPAVVQVPAIKDSQLRDFQTENFEGKWTLVFFGYTHCPDICAPTLVQLAQLHKELDQRSFDLDRIQMLMVSIDPAYDTADTMSRFLKRFSPHMLGLLPDQYQLQAWAQVFYTHYAPTSSAGVIDHSGNVALVNPDGLYIGFFRPPLLVQSMANMVELAQLVYLKDQTVFSRPTHGASPPVANIEN